MTYGDAFNQAVELVGADEVHRWLQEIMMEQVAEGYDTDPMEFVTVRIVERLQYSQQLDAARVLQEGK